MAEPEAQPNFNKVGQRLTEQQTSLSLLERVRANDPRAWKRLVELYLPLVHSWCSMAGLKGPDTEDTAQEIFAAAAASLACFRRDRPGDTFRGWLRGITRNHILLFFRRNRGEPVAEGGSDAWQNLQQVPELVGDEQTEVGELYRRALDLVHCEFEERTWQAFWLTVIEGRTPCTLAAELGITAGGIRQAKCRVLRRLKQELGDLID